MTATKGQRIGKVNQCEKLITEKMKSQSMTATNNKKRGNLFNESN